MKRSLEMHLISPVESYKAEHTVMFSYTEPHDWTDLIAELTTLKAVSSMAHSSIYGTDLLATHFL